MDKKYIEIDQNYIYFMNIPKKVIVDDLLKLVESNILPIHLNAKKDSTIHFKNNIPEKQLRKRNQPTLIFFFCPYCMKLLGISNRSKTQNNHFLSVHKSLPNSVKFNLLKMLKDDGLKYYRKIQLLAIFIKIAFLILKVK